MKQNKKVAITGGIGSGKSTVAKIIKEQGYVVFSCDEIYAELINDRAFLRRLCDNFGEILDCNGQLNRVKLSEIVFNDENKLRQLNNITHPAIIKEMFRRADKLNTICFFEVPLLFENGYENYFDETIVVLRELSKRIESVVLRDDLSKDEVKKRINSQFNYNNCDFAKYYVIHNNGDFNALKSKVVDLIKQITESNKKNNQF